MDVALIPSATLLAWRDLALPGALKIVLKGVVFAVLALVGLCFFLGWLVGLIVPPDLSLPWVGTVGWLQALAGGAMVLTMLAASVFLMVPVASIFTGFFLEDVADLVEKKHYPNLPAVGPARFWETLADTLKFFGVVVLANIVALFIYPFVLPFAPVLFLALNGYLLGREYFQMAAVRRMSKADARALYVQNRALIWTMGAVMALPLSVPILNLVVPVVGAAAFTHLFHGLATRQTR